MMAPLKKQGHSQVRPPVPIPRTDAAKQVSRESGPRAPRLGSQTVDTITRRTARRLLPESDTPGVSAARSSGDGQLAAAFPGNPQTPSPCGRSVWTWLASCTCTDRARTPGLTFMASRDLRRHPSRVTATPVSRGSHEAREGQRRQCPARAACHPIAVAASTRSCAPVRFRRTCSAGWKGVILRPTWNRTAHSAMPAGPARRPAIGRGGPGQCVCELLIDTPEARLAQKRGRPREGAAATSP